MNSSNGLPTNLLPKRHPRSLPWHLDVQSPSFWGASGIPPLGNNLHGMSSPARQLQTTGFRQPTSAYAGFLTFFCALPKSVHQPKLPGCVIITPPPPNPSIREGMGCVQQGVIPALHLPIRPTTFSLRERRQTPSSASDLPQHRTPCAAKIRLAAAGL